MRCLKIFLLVTILVTISACGQAGTSATEVPTKAPTEMPTSIPAPTNMPEPTSTPAPTNTPAPTSPPVPTSTPVYTELQVTGYGYQYQDVGDGWYEAVVGVAFENLTNQIGLFTLGSRGELPTPIVETEEGVTYEGSLEVMGWSRPFEAEHILDCYVPPGFRVRAMARTGPPFPTQVVFRFAHAAHPTLIRLPGWGDIDLITAESNQLGFVGDPAEIRSITDLYGRVLIDNPGGVYVEVERCEFIASTPGDSFATSGEPFPGYGRTPTLALIIENRNGLQEETFDLDFPFIYITPEMVSTWTPNWSSYWGTELLWYNNPPYTIGPGQTREDELWLPYTDDNFGRAQYYKASYLALWNEEMGEFTVYSMHDCTANWSDD